jgi:hypothetical protein
MIPQISAFKCALSPSILFCRLPNRRVFFHSSSTSFLHDKAKKSDVEMTRPTDYVTRHELAAVIVDLRNHFDSRFGNLQNF